MNKILTHLIMHKAKYKHFAPIVIMAFLFISTLLITVTGGIPSAFADTMYIPVLLSAFYFGPLAGVLTGLAAGFLAGPFMVFSGFDVHTEPFLNSLYRTLYFIAIGGGIGTLFTFFQKRMTRFYIQSEELNATLMSIGDAVVITDEFAVIKKVNSRAATLIGLEMEAIVNRPFSTIFEMYNDETNEKTPDPIKEVLEGGLEVELEHHAVLKNYNGEFLHIEDSASPIRSPKGELIGAILVFRDVSDRKAKEARIVYISYHDYLTELPNRRYFQERLEALDTPEHLPLGVFMMDLNALKVINDAYGHEKGNVALKHVAQSLNAVKREEDLVARIGGDEFAMIVPKADEASMQSIQERLDSKVTQKSIDGIPLSLAIGYAFKEKGENTIRKVMRSAENKMYKNKMLSSKSTRNKAIMGILNTLTDKYEDEKRHSDRVARFSRLIGENLNFKGDDLKELELAGRLHDIGKITVSDAILKKDGPLTQEEWTAITRHTINGYQILRAADRYSRLAEYAMSHHERMDGKGYPHQTKGDDIPLFSRIISVADAFEAMTSDRPYRAAMSEEKALEELKRHAGTQFDPKLVTLFTEKVYPKLNTTLVN